MLISRLFRFELEKLIKSLPI